MPSRRVLVTGSNGLIGYALSARLLDLGRDVVGMDLVRLPGDPAAFDLVEGDLLDVHCLHATLRRYDVGAIVHCGGVSGPMLARDNPFHVFQTNVDGTLNVCEAAR